MSTVSQSLEHRPHAHQQLRQTDAQLTLSPLLSHVVGLSRSSTRESKSASRMRPRTAPTKRSLTRIAAASRTLKASARQSTSSIASSPPRYVRPATASVDCKQKQKRRNSIAAKRRSGSAAGVRRTGSRRSTAKTQDDSSHGNNHLHVTDKKATRRPSSSIRIGLHGHSALHTHDNSTSSPAVVNRPRPAPQLRRPSLFSSASRMQPPPRRFSVMQTCTSESVNSSPYTSTSTLNTVQTTATMSPDSSTEAMVCLGKSMSNAYAHTPVYAAFQQNIQTMEPFPARIGLTTEFESTAYTMSESQWKSRHKSGVLVEFFKHYSHAAPDKDVFHHQRHHHGNKLHRKHHGSHRRHHPGDEFVRRMQGRTMNYAEFYQFARQWKVCPELCRRFEIVAAFDLIVTQQGKLNRERSAGQPVHSHTDAPSSSMSEHGELTLEGFMYAIGVLGILIFSRPVYANEMPDDPAHKVDALLEKLQVLDRNGVTRKLRTLQHYATPSSEPSWTEQDEEDAAASAAAAAGGPAQTSYKSLHQLTRQRSLFRMAKLHSHVQSKDDEKEAILRHAAHLQKRKQKRRAARERARTARPSRPSTAPGSRAYSSTHSLTARGSTDKGLYEDDIGDIHECATLRAGQAPAETLQRFQEDQEEPDISKCSRSWQDKLTRDLFGHLNGDVMKMVRRHLFYSDPRKWKNYPGTFVDMGAIVYGNETHHQYRIHVANNGSVPMEIRVSCQDTAPFLAVRYRQAMPGFENIVPGLQQTIVLTTNHDAIRPYFASHDSQRVSSKEFHGYIQVECVWRHHVPTVVGTTSPGLASSTRLVTETVARTFLIPTYLHVAAKSSNLGKRIRNVRATPC
jgi:hypothetical protein